MDVIDLKTLYADLKKRMDQVIEHLRHDLAGVRTGRATINILDPVHVDAYGTRMPLNQVATLSIPDHPEIARGTLRALIARAGLTIEDFLAALGR